MMSRCLFLLLLAQSAVAGQASPDRSVDQSDPTFLGVLEVVRPVGPSPLRESESFSQLRYVFVRLQSGWSAVPRDLNLPVSMTWYVADGGQTVGSARTRSPAFATSGPRAYGLPLEDPFTYLPETPGNPMFNYYTYSTSVRPLIAVTRSDGTTDPDNWTRFQLSALELVRVMDSMRKRAPELPICSNLGLQSHAPYTSEDVEVVGSFRDRKRRMIIGVQFDQQARERSSCGNFDDFPELRDVWLLMLPDGTVSELGLRMFPVGAADLDRDGHSEWVFKLTRGNGDGYRLLHSDLSRKVDSTWPP